MRAYLLIWLVLSVIGGIVIALPDSGNRVISFSAAHGPTLLDLIGIGILAVGWLIFLRAAWQQRRLVIRRASPRLAGFVLFLVGLGSGLIIASVAGDFPYWWVVGAALLVLAQVGVAALARD